MLRPLMNLCICLLTVTYASTKAALPSALPRGSFRFSSHWYVHTQLGCLVAMLSQRNVALPLCTTFCLSTGMDGSIICAPQQSGCRAVRAVTQHCVQDTSSLQFPPYQA